MNPFAQTASLASVLFGCRVQELPKVLETTSETPVTVSDLGNLVKIAKSLRFAKDTKEGVYGAKVARVSVTTLCVALRFANNDNFVLAQQSFSVGVEFLKNALAVYVDMLQELKNLPIDAEIELVTREMIELPPEFNSSS